MKIIEVKFKKLHELATIPKQAHPSLSGGWDVTATEIIQEHEDFVIVKLGFALEVPVGYKVTLVPRSSFTKTKWILQNSPGLGDCDYRGEYQYRFRALPYGVKYISDLNSYALEYPEPPYKVGDTVGQIYIEEVIGTKFIVSDTLSDTDRGDGGFGSTTK